jgi:hypothetical protein
MNAADTERRLAVVDEVVQLPEEEQVLVSRAMNSIAEAQRKLGAEEERHEKERRKCLQELRMMRTQYESLVSVLASKYAPAGKFHFRPDLAAFVATEEKK